MMDRLLLGIDSGTSACKVALFSEDGQVVAQESASYAVSYPRPGWAEQDPVVWWEAVCEALRNMLERAGIDASRIAGIGIAGQSWSAIALDKDGNVLCPTPIWMDTRAADICAALEERLGADRLFQISGNPLQPSYTLPKILWYKEHRPEVYEKADKILQSNSYIGYRLTGAVTQDYSQGYGLQCFDIQKKAWDYALCAEMGIRSDLLPAQFPSDAIIGHVTSEAAALTGLAEGIPVVAGGLDAACGTLGAGAIDPGETQEQGGQAGGMSICMDRCHMDERLILGCHVVPERWLLQGGTVGGGGALKWLRETCCPELTFAEMSGLAASVSAGADGLVFLPYMAGERSPLWSPDAKGVFFGLNYSKSRAHMIRAVMEGVAFALRHNLEVAGAAGASVETLRAMGGAANSKVWTQVKSDITAKPIEVPGADAATTLGAALLAGVAVGMYRDYEDAVKKTVQVKRRHAPNKSNREIYDRNYRMYREIYERLAPVMREEART